VSEYGLTSPSTHYRSFRRWFFPDNKFLPARRIRKRGTCHGNVKTWLAGWLDGCHTPYCSLSKRPNLS